MKITLDMVSIDLTDLEPENIDLKQYQGKYSIQIFNKKSEVHIDLNRKDLETLISELGKKL